MDVRNCPRCGRIYVYDGFNICLNCRKEDEKDFLKVKEYIDDNPGCNTQEVSEATEVSVKKIIKFLKEGRLEIKDESNILLKCEKCGKSIKTGRFCKKCAMELKKEFKNAIAGRKDPNTMKDGRLREKIRITEKYR